MSDFQISYSSRDGSTQTLDLNGVSWTDAPLPRRWHKCWVQTTGYISYFTSVQRCPCGAISMNGGRWSEKNRTRRDRRRAGRAR